MHHQSHRCRRLLDPNSVRIHSYQWYNEYPYNLNDGRANHQDRCLVHISHHSRQIRCDRHSGTILTQKLKLKIWFIPKHDECPRTIWIGIFYSESFQNMRVEKYDSSPSLVSYLIDQICVMQNATWNNELEQFEEIKLPTTQWVIRLLCITQIKTISHLPLDFWTVIPDSIINCPNYVDYGMHVFFLDQLLCLRNRIEIKKHMISCFFAFSRLRTKWQKRYDNRLLTDTWIYYRCSTVDLPAILQHVYNMHFDRSNCHLDTMCPIPHNRMHRLIYSPVCTSNDTIRVCLCIRNFRRIA